MPALSRIPMVIELPAPLSTRLERLARRPPPSLRARTSREATLRLAIALGLRQLEHHAELVPPREDARPLDEASAPDER